MGDRARLSKFLREGLLQSPSTPIVGAERGRGEVLLESRDFSMLPEAQQKEIDT